MIEESSPSKSLKPRTPKRWGFHRRAAFISLALVVTTVVGALLILYIPPLHRAFHHVSESLNKHLFSPISHWGNDTLSPFMKEHASLLKMIGYIGAGLLTTSLIVGGGYAFYKHTRPRRLLVIFK